MPSLEYFVVGRDASVDAFTGSVSVFSILDELNIRRLPAFINRAIAAIGWNTTPEEKGQQVDAKLEVRGADGNMLMEQPIPFVVEGRRQRHISYLIGLRVELVGEMKFTLLLGKEPVAHHSLLVNEPDANVPPDGWLLYGPSEKVPLPPMINPESMVGRPS